MKKLFLFLLLFFMALPNVLAEGYLTNIKIDDVDYSEFSSDKDTYELSFDSSKDKVKIICVYDTSLYRGLGTGGIGTGYVNLSYGTKEYKFTLTSISDASDQKTYTFKITREDTRSSDNALKSLTVGSQQVILSDKNDYEVSVDNSVNKVEVHAEVKDSKATLVSGYGERLGDNALTLNDQNTSFEIKVQAENGDIRTYKIIVMKTNYLSNDASLQSLKVDPITFNFKKDKYEYSLKVLESVEKVKIEAIPSNSKASVEYDKEVILAEGENVISINVKAEDGTKKTYKLIINREKELPLVADIKIDSVNFKFDPTIYDYDIKTNLKTLDFKITLNSETATSKVLNNENLEDGSVIKVEVVDGAKKAVYTFTIKEIKEVEVETKEDLVVSKKEDSNFFKKYEMPIALIIFGIGLLSMLIANLVKTKSKVM